MPSFIGQVLPLKGIWSSAPLHLRTRLPQAASQRRATLLQPVGGVQLQTKTHFPYLRPSYATVERVARGATRYALDGQSIMRENEIEKESVWVWGCERDSAIVQ